MHKQNRLHSSRSFDYIYKHGASFKDRFLVLFVVKSKVKEPKVGFSVGKKVGGSVQRNKTKRRLKNALYGVFTRVKKGNNYVVVARAGSAEQPFMSLSKSLVSLFEAAGCLAAEEVSRE